MKKFSKHSDQELVSLLATENATAAFTELYDRYWKKLLMQAFSKLGNKAEAEEVVQDVFMNLWSRRDQLEIKFNFHTYIASSVKYEILSKLAKQEKKQTLKNNLRHNAISNRNTVEEWMDYETTRIKIESTVQQLSDKCQLTFRLSREEGLSHQEIAATLDISPKTVEAHLTKALKKLRSSVQVFFSWLI